MNTSSFWFQGVGGVDPDDPGFPIGQSLRFSELTGYPLQGPQDNTDGFGANWTISFWFKWAGNSTRNTLMWTSSPAGNYTSLNISQTNFGDLNASNRSADYFFNGIRLRDTGAWYHFVFNPNQFWINGEPQYPPANYWGNMEVNQYISTGWDSNSTISGYYADWYLLQQTLTADTFGRFNENGVWVPKDPEFPSAAVYSSFLTTTGTVSAGHPASDAFDGNTGNYFTCNESSGTFTFAPEPGIDFNTIEVYMKSTSGTDVCSHNGNSGNAVSNAWTEVINVPGTINSTTPLTITNTGSNPQLAGIKVDGEILIDQNLWSYYLYTYEPTSATEDPTPAMLASTNKDFLPSGPPSNGFDSAGTGSTTFTNANGEAWLWRPDTPITDVTLIEVANGTSEACWVNGVNSGTTGTNTTVYTEVYNGPPITLTTLSGLYTPGWTPAATSSSGFSALKINGVMYVDGADPVWGAKGFHLTFADPNNIGKDYSGNGNDFTATGFDTAPVGIFSDMLFSDDVNSSDPADIDFNSTDKNWSSGIPTSGFDNQLTTFVQTNGTWIFRPDPPIENATLVEVFQTNSSTAQQLFFNSVNVGRDDYVGSSWTEVYNGAATTINNIAGNFLPSGGNGFAGIRVNGQVLVDNTGTDYDLMQDSPTQNYSTGNPLMLTPAGNNNTRASLRSANLEYYGLSSQGVVEATFYLPQTGQWYWENTVTSAAASSYPGFGIRQGNYGLSDCGAYTCPLPEYWNVYRNGTVYKNNASITPATSSLEYGVNDVVGLAYDADRGKIWISINGVFSPEYGSPTAAGSTADGWDIEPNFNWTPFTYESQTYSSTTNFGQINGFRYPVEDYKALNTESLPKPTIYDGRTEFRAITGPGNADVMIWRENSGK